MDCFHLARNSRIVTYSFLLQVIVMDEEDNATSGSGSASNKKTRGPTVCKKLKKRLEKQTLECTINFDEYGQPCGDMLKDFTIYLGSVV